jgi:hypothetical protein
MNNAHSETGQMAVCSQNLTLGALSSLSALSVLVGALFKKFVLFLNTPRIITTCKSNTKAHDPQKAPNNPLSGHRSLQTVLPEEAEC